MLKFKTILLSGTIIAASVCALTANAHDDKEKGPQVTRTFDLTDFDEISIGGVYEVDIQVGDKHSISLSGGEDEMAHIDVYVKDGTLYLSHDKDKHKKKRKGHHDGIEAMVSLPALNGLRVAGVASGDVSGVDADDFSLKVSGVAEVEIDGTCNSLSAKVSGVGELDAENFKCKNADVTLSGVGQMNVYASKSVDVTASGVGEVNVYGDPKEVSKSKAMFTEINIK